MVARQQRDADRIIEDPEVLGGKPTIRGTRIAVGVVLAYLANNPNFDELFADYPRLTMDDVQACFSYAESVVEDHFEQSATSAHK